MFFYSPVMTNSTNHEFVILNEVKELHNFHYRESSFIETLLVAGLVQVLHFVQDDNGNVGLKKKKWVILTG